MLQEAFDRTNALASAVPCKADVIRQPCPRLVRDLCGFSPLLRYGENSGDSAHAEPHLSTTSHHQFFAQVFCFQKSVIRKGLPKVAVTGLGAGGPRFKSGRPDQSFQKLTGISQKPFPALWGKFGGPYWIIPILVIQGVVGEPAIEFFFEESALSSSSPLISCMNWAGGPSGLMQHSDPDHIALITKAKRVGGLDQPER